MTGRNIQQPEPRHGDHRGDQLGEEAVAEAVAGEAQLGEAGLKFQGTKERVEGGGGQAEAAHRHRGAPVLHLAQPGHALVLLCGGDERDIAS